MKTLRVLVIRNAYQQDAGGAEQYALNLCIALHNSGHKPYLVTKVQRIIDKAKVQQITTIRGKWHDAQQWSKSYYLRYSLMIAWYMWVIVTKRIDVVHPQSRDDFVFASRAAWLLNKKVIWTDHGDLKYILDNVNHYNPRMRSWVVTAAKHTRHILCVSESEKMLISNVAPELNNLTVVHNGVFVPPGPEPRPKTNKVVVGTNARLVAAKGIAELIEAVGRLKGKDVDLWLVGGESGNLAHYKKVASANSLTDRVRFIGYVPNPNDYVAAMDVFVHASYHEAFSLAIIEAAMLARPIIATAVGGTPEIIDSGCGVLVPPRDSEAITNALTKLLNDKALGQRLGKAAQLKAHRLFDFQKIVDQKVIPLYKD